jgi:hypothetical protein
MRNQSIIVAEVEHGLEGASTVGGKAKIRKVWGLHGVINWGLPTEAKLSSLGLVLELMYARDLLRHTHPQPR